MDINTEVRHGETLLAADRRCYRVLAVRTSAVSPARPEPEGGGWRRRVDRTSLSGSWSWTVDSVDSVDSLGSEQICV